MFGVFNSEGICEYPTDTREEAVFYITSNSLSLTHWVEEAVKCPVCERLIPISSTIFGRDYCFECALKRSKFDTQPYLEIFKDGS